MFDIHHELSKLPPDAAGVCEIAGRLITEWFGPIQAGDGYSPQEIADTERALGFALPAALRWIYRELGRRDDLVRRQDPLLVLDALRIRDDILVFREENQRVALWGVQTADVAHDDPPVVWQDLNTSGGDAPWQPYQDRLSAALLELILSESMLATGSNLLHCETGEEVLSGLPPEFELIPELAHVFHPIPDGPEVMWSASPDALLRADGETWAWLYAPDPAALDRARQKLPGDWAPIDE